jgi:energy-coupling factor transporter transmembrane protein EcfT
MAELSVFGYRRLATPLHALDARIKLACLLVLSTASLAAGPIGMALATALAALGFCQTHTALRQVARELRYFLFLMLGVCLIRAITTPGDPLLPWSPVALSRQGALEGAMLCWRWLLIVVLGMILCTTTRSSEIRAAVEWLLRPVPWICAHKVGTMIGLLMRFIPVILTQARENADAQRARAVENRKNPIYRMHRLGMPLLRRTFLMADRLVMAMEARCYGDGHTPHTWHIGSAEWKALAVVVAVSGIMVFL